MEGEEMKLGNTSGLFFIFIRIVKKNSPSLGPGAAVGAVETFES